MRRVRSTAKQAGEGFIFANAEQQVDLRHGFLQFLAVALGKAAGDDEPLAAAALFILRHLQNGVDGLLLGALDKAAGVYD